jgi:hypothetical protein
MQFVKPTLLATVAGVIFALGCGGATTISKKGGILEAPQAKEGEAPTGGKKVQPGLPSLPKNPAPPEKPGEEK